MAISNNPPVTNAALAEKNKAAQAIHMQEQFKAGAAPQDTSALAKLGAAFTGGQREQDLAGMQAQAATDVANVERQQQQSQMEQASQNIRTQEQLTQAIQEQKNELFNMNLDISEEEFSDELAVKRLEATGNFENDTQLMDLAALQFENEEEFKEMALMSQQLVEQQLKDDLWELSVYEQAEADAEMRDTLQKDRRKSQELAEAKKRAQEKVNASRKKAGAMQKMVGAAKFVAGAVITVWSGGSAAGAGVPLMASGAGDVATAE